MSTLTGIERTQKSGRVAAWERGGGYRNENSGDAWIYTAPDGTPCRPFFVQTRGEWPGDNRHALVPLEIGSWGIALSLTLGKFNIEVFRFERFDLEKNLGEVNVVETCQDGNWKVHRRDIVVPAGVRAAIRAARRKAACTGCRTPSYVLPR